MSIIDLQFLSNYTTLAPGDSSKNQGFLDASEASIITYLGYDPSVNQYNETYNFPAPTQKVNLINYPIQNIYSVKINGTPLTAMDLQVNKALGIIYLLLPPYGPFTLEIDYDAGYTAIPKDIQDATAKLATWNLARLNSGDIGVRSRMVGESTTSYEIDMPLSIKNQLNPYKRTALFMVQPTQTITFGTR